jgi:CBS domain-containing protein
MLTGEICTREVFFTSPQDSVATAARDMLKRGVGALVVVEAQGKKLRPVGMVTDRDLVCRQLARSADLHCLTVGDVMSSPVTTVREQGGLEETLRQMAAARVRRAPVVNANGELVGIISYDDLLPALAEQIGNLGRLIARHSR